MKREIIGIIVQEILSSTTFYLYNIIFFIIFIIDIL